MKIFKLTLSICLLSVALIGCVVPSVKPLGDIDYGWLCRYSKDTSYIYFEERFGGCGWSFKHDGDSVIDLSDYDRLRIVCKNVEPAITKMSASVTYADSNKRSWALAPVVDGNVTINVDLDAQNSMSVKTVQLMSNRRGGVELVEAAFHVPVKYQPPVALQVRNGLISSNQFDGFSDDARIEFNYYLEGEMTMNNEDGTISPMTNWSTGIICSYADVLGFDLPQRYITLSGVGKQKYSCYLSDLRYMLEKHDEDGDCGIYWNIWKMGNITEARFLNVTISEPRKSYK